jgi:hypothetical protein
MIGKTTVEICTCAENTPDTMILKHTSDIPAVPMTKPAKRPPPACENFSQEDG